MRRVAEPHMCGSEQQYCFLCQQLAGAVGLGHRHQHVASAGGEEVGDVKPAVALQHARDVLLAQQALYEFGLGEVARVGDLDEVHLVAIAARAPTEPQLATPASATSATFGPSIR
jgi:hypothetical protein